VIKTGFVSLGLADRSLAGVLQAAVTMGCEAIELNGRATVHQGLWQGDVDMAAIGGRIAESGITVTSLGGYSNLAQPADEALEAEVEQLLGYCRIARDMGIPIVRAFAGDVIEGYDLDALYPRIVQGFRAVADAIQGWGVTLGIENHGRLMNDGDLLQRLIYDVDSPLVRITLDTGNFCWAGHSIATAHGFFQKLAPLVVNVHVKDGRFQDGVWHLLPAGRGDIDLVGLFEVLRSLGYDGPVLSEYEGPDDFMLSTAESVSYLRGLRDCKSV
jgi:L-ribulose-5-phosphate 3-epimerase